MSRSFSFVEARRLDPAKYRGWVLLISMITAGGITALVALRWWLGEVNDTMLLAMLIVCAVSCWTGVVITLLGAPTAGAFVVMASMILEINASMFVTTRFPPPGLLALPAVVAAAGLLFGPRPSFVFAVCSTALSLALVFLSPSLRDIAARPESVYLLAVLALVTLALWAAVATAVSAFGMMVEKASEKERELTETIRAAPDGILVMEATGRILSANPAAERVLGRSAAELAGLAIDDALGLGGQASRLLAPEGPMAGEDGPMAHTLMRADGRPLQVELTVRTMEDGRAQLLIRDVTERTRAEAARRALEEQAVSAQRLEAVGQLAGGIAHEFNNVFTAVGGSAELLRMDLQDAEQLALVDELLAAQARGARLTQQLLAFSRRDLVQLRLSDVGKKVAGMRAHLEHVAGDRVRVEFKLQAECNAAIDAGHVERALASLVANARDAMPAGGTCTITVSRETSQSGAVVVRIAVGDHGVGMDPDTLANAFTPFFSTKARGLGTGLGLASVHGMALQSGGTVHLQSVRGRGTVVTLEFPCVDSSGAVASAPTSPAASMGALATILVAEDDAGTRSIIVRALERAGYRVLAARDGIEGAQMLARHGDAVDLLVADVLMPGLTGPQLAERARAQLAGLPVVFISGYPADARSGEREMDLAHEVLAKPFTREALCARVAESLATSPRRTTPDGRARVPE